MLRRCIPCSHPGCVASLINGLPWESMRMCMRMRSYGCIAGFRPIIRLARRPPINYGQIPLAMGAEVEPTVGTFSCTIMWNMNSGVLMRAMGDMLPYQLGGVSGTSHRDSGLRCYRIWSM